MVLCICAMHTLGSQGIGLLAEMLAIPSSRALIIIH